jgi:hypothetical protein
MENERHFAGAAPLPYRCLSFLITNRSLFINLKVLTEFIEIYYIFTMLKATPVQSTAASHVEFTPKTHRQFCGAELTTDPASGINYTLIPEQRV